MSQLSSLKQEIPKWTLETDRQLAKGLEASTEQMYNGIKDVITALRQLDQSTEDCCIRLKHAVNWVNSLTYTKFIENNIQPAGSEVPSQQPTTPAVTVARTPEQIMAKYRKAIEIAISDLNLKDLKPEEGMTVADAEAAENQTMAAGAMYVTPQLRKKLPYLIGSKEFNQGSYLGIDVGASVGALTEETLKKLEKGEEEKPKDASPAAAAGGSVAPVLPPSQSVPVKAESVLVPQSQSLSSALEEVKVAESVVPGSQAAPTKKYDASSYLDSYASGPKQSFSLEGADEDEVLPQFRKGEEKTPDQPALPAAVIPPPEVNIPVPGLPSAQPEEAKKASALFGEPEVVDKFAELRKSQLQDQAKSSKQADFKEKMNKLFSGADEENEKQADPFEAASAIMSHYKETPLKLFSDGAEQKSAEPPLLFSSTVAAPIVKFVPQPPANISPPPAPVPQQEAKPEEPKPAEAAPITKEKKEEMAKRMSKLLVDDEDEEDSQPAAGKKNLFSE